MTTANPQRTTTLSNMKLVAEELAWLQANPHFDLKPASITEFLGPRYLNFESKVRSGLKKTLVEIFGQEVQTERLGLYQRAMMTGAIGIGKTTFASIVLPYMVHWVMCLRDPQDFFNLMPGSRIAFMQMSTSANQAVEVIFGDIKARIDHSPWFAEYAPYDPKFTKQIRFAAKDIWILPGDSAETTFEGYNILGGIIDEMDSHKITKEKDYAVDGYNTISARITSRFEDQGLLILIGQMKKNNGFAAKKYREFLEDPYAHVTRMTLWESYGWDYKDHRSGKSWYLDDQGNRNSFFYDIKRHTIYPNIAGPTLPKSENIVEVPNKYMHDFENNPERALKDLAGIPPATSDPFISLVDRIEACRDGWIDRYNTPGTLRTTSPVTNDPLRPTFEKWFKAQDSRKRVMHIDMATSGDGDALGMAMGHIEGLIEIEGETKPLIVIDFLARVKASAGTEIMLSDIRSIIYYVREVLGFKLKKVTMDGFQSTDTMQQLRKKRFQVDYLSVDKSTLPYEDLREAIYEGRLEFPKFMSKNRRGDTEEVEILIKELMELHDDGRKIDHPVGGSKDVADAVAGVVNTLMGSRTYRSGLSSLDNRTPVNGSLITTTKQDTGNNSWPKLLDGLNGLRAPVPPTTSSSSSNIPLRLLPK